MFDPHPDCRICRATGPLAAPRNVATFADLTVAEQFTLLARLDEPLAEGAMRLAVAEDHGHFHPRPGGAELALMITTRKADPLLPLIANGIDAEGSVGLKSGSARHILFRKFIMLSTKKPATHYYY